MTAIHLSTPASPKTPACGAADAKRFTMWRWRATCAMCKSASAARPLDVAHQAEVKHMAGLPVRYSRLVAHVRAHGTGDVESAIREFERDKQIASHCSKHGAIADPIALYDVPGHRMVFACPECTTGPVKDQWEAER